MIRLADYVAKKLAQYGIKHVFLVTGGGAMHLNDAFGRSPDIRYVACHHEQACAMAAESYFRMSQRVAAVNVTTGPGGTNAITGVWGAWVDSLAMVVISGQVKWETTVRSTGLPLRQLGDQEIDIVKVVEPMTKYAVMVTDPKTIRYHLERALHLTTHGRPGPVWIDIPINIQATMVDEASLEGYDPKEDEIAFETKDLPGVTTEMLGRLAAAKRPVILAGSAVRTSSSHAAFLRVVEKLGIPVTTAWNSHDLIWNDHPLYIGRPGFIGDRAGNFAVQNADFVLVLGSRVTIRQVSYNWGSWARAAFKVMVDIDANELKKPTIKIDVPIHADIRDLLAQLESAPYAGPTLAHKEYLAWCHERRAKFPAVLPEYWNNRETVNPYCFADSLFRALKEGAKVVTADGTACVATFQAANLKPGQRLYTNAGSAPMGYDLPGAIGACFANEGREVICIAGDGSMQMNLQELQTIVTHRLPIKIFVLNNRGYHSIRQTQQNFFSDNIVGCGVESGLGFPDLKILSAAYGIPYSRIENHQELDAGIQAVLDQAGVQICEVILDLRQQFSPKIMSRKLPDGRMVSPALEDMWPFLERDEFQKNMLIPLAES